MTAGGVRHPLPEPFFVIATQNPLELEGTYPLPEAQLDRFTAKIPFRPPRREVWLRILTEEPKAPEPVEVDLLKAQEEAKEVRVAKEALEAITHVAFLTQEDQRLRMGLSPAGPKRGFPRPGPRLPAGKPFVDWKELKDAAFLALPHRLFLTEEALYAGESAEGVLKEALRKGGIP